MMAMQQCWRSRLAERAWIAVARVVSRPAVAHWLIGRSMRTPYRHITGPDGTIYMGRWWLFNPYPASDAPRSQQEAWDASWRAHLPSVRIHHILRRDSDRHPHDHPWDARTVVLRNGYEEERPTSLADHARIVYWRARGYTGTLLFGQFHRISYVPPGGVWTLFITWRKQGTWGFLVNGQKVPWREYLGAPIDRDKGAA